MTTEMQQPLEEEKFDPRQYLAIYIFRWKIMILTFLICLLGGVLYVDFVPKQYLTQFTIRVWRDPSLQVGNRQSSSINAYMWLLSGDELKLKVVDELAEDWLERVGGIEAMKLRVKVAGVPDQQGMLTISLENTEPEYARAYLSKLWERFQERQKEMKDEAIATVVGQLKDEIDLLEDRVEESENDLLDYARLNQLDLTSAKGSLESRYLMALLSYQSQINTELMLIDAQYPELKGASPTVIQDAGMLSREAGGVTPVEGRGVADGDVKGTDGDLLMKVGSQRTPVDSPEVSEWQMMKGRLQELQTKEKDLLSKFQPDHPEVRDVQKKIAELDDQIQITGQIALSRINDRREALRIAKNALEVPIRTWKNTYSLASQKNAAYRRKSLVVQRTEQQYRDLYQKLADLKVSEEMKAEHVSLIEQVRTLPDPVWPNVPKIILMVLVMALGSGVGLATLAHIFDNRMQTISDVERVVGVPFLGGIPHWARRSSASSVRPIVLEEHASGAIEAYRVLRTSTMAAVEKSGNRTVLITSSESKEGKTLTAINLSVMIAKAGKKVLLIDMDLRRPRVHKSFNVEKVPGMTEVLSGKISLEKAIVPTGVDNLWFVPGGESIDNAAEILQATDMNALLDQVRTRFDIVLIDTSPVLRTADASIIAKPSVCSVVFVASVNKTPKPLVKYALSQLGKARILGVVMNNIEMNNISSLYYTYQYPNYAYYAYAYAYGYNYDYLYAEGGGKVTRPAARRWSDAVKSAGRWLRRTFLPLE